MNTAKTTEFMARIDGLKSDDHPTFGKMNANQMLCHCADFYRMALGTKHAEEYGKVDPKAIRAKAQLGQPVPAPKGFGQVEGKGTPPTTFENDKRMLKDLMLRFSQLPPDFEFAPHPYFGKLDRAKWIGLAQYHLNHHLRQFQR